ncbi:hypothetical protein CR513_23020, partial [Mucuna pruriens]
MMRLLAAGIIYPISNSQWVSLVQVVPKKFGMIVMKNRHDEMVQPSSARHQKPKPKASQPGRDSAHAGIPVRLGTEKPKVIRGDRLEHQRTLVDLNLSILASRGESSPSSMAIVVEDGIIESRPC